MYRLSDLASLVGGQIHGDADPHISGINDLRLAKEGELSFLNNSKYLKAALQTSASAILVSRADKDHPFPCALVEVEDPTQSFALIAEKFAPAEIEWEQVIDPTASVADSAHLAPGVHIGPHAVIEAFAQIGEGSHIGAGCYVGHETKIGCGSFLYPRVVVRERSVIGNRVIIHSGAVIGSDGFGYEFENGQYRKIPQTGYVQIDDDVEIGANTTIDRGRFNKTWIQKGAKIDNLVMLAHNTIVGAHSVIVAQSGVSGSTKLGSYVTIGGQVGLVGHLSIGDQVTITAQSGVTKDLLSPGIYRGAPARPFKQQMKIEALIQKLPDLFQMLKRLPFRDISKK